MPDALQPADTDSLWRELHGELFAFLRARVESEAAAEDILQTAFLRAHARLAVGDSPDSPRAWLYQIVRNLLVDAHRRARSQLKLVSEAREDPTYASPDAPGEGAFEVVARALPRFITDLEQPYRDALQWTEIEGLTQAEAAARAGLSVSGMKSRVQRGRAKVFDALKRCCQLALDPRGHLMTCESRDDADCCR